MLRIAFSQGNNDNNNALDIQVALYECVTVGTLLGGEWGRQQAQRRWYLKLYTTLCVSKYACVQKSGSRNHDSTTRHTYTHIRT